MPDTPDVDDHKRASHSSSRSAVGGLVVSEQIGHWCTCPDPASHQAEAYSADEGSKPPTGNSTIKQLTRSVYTCDLETSGTVTRPEAENTSADNGSASGSEPGETISYDQIEALVTYAEVSLERCKKKDVELAELKTRLSETIDRLEKGERETIGKLLDSLITIGDSGEADSMREAKRKWEDTLGVKYACAKAYALCEGDDAP